MDSMGYLLLAVLACAVSLGYGEDGERTPDLTVTDEAWFEVEIRDYDGPGDDFRGRFVIALFGKEVPITALNFIKLTKGYEVKKAGGRTEKLSFKNTVFHRIVQDFIIQGGDVTVGDGTGGKSIYGKEFNDEGFTISHKARGYVSMANHGRDTNGSQFIIVLNKARWLDSQHVVFGKIVEGMDVVQKIGDVPTNKDTKPKKKIKIVDCGVNEVKNPYTLTEEEATSDEDISRD